MSLGKCRHCGYNRVAYDALICPACGGLRPNPSVFSQLAMVGMIGFFVVFGLVLLSTAQQSNQDAQEMRQQTQRAEQQACERWPDPATRPPWCN